MSKVINNKPRKSTKKFMVKASVIICNTYETASSFLDAFETIRKNRSARGGSTDEEQDLLRAMLIFSTSGLDSMFKQLIKDALPEVINKNEGALKKFESHLRRKLISKNNEFNVELLASALVQKNPRKALIMDLVQDLTSGSLQSAEELFRVASYFDISTKKLTDNAELIKKIFDIRNQITHEMDVDFNQARRNRRPRGRDDMISFTEEIFKLSNKILNEVKNKL